MQTERVRGTRRWCGLAILVLLAVLASACGARFEDTASTTQSGGLGSTDAGGSAGPGTTAVGDGSATTLPGATITTLATGGVATPTTGGAIDPGPTTGVTADSIKIGVLVPITGAAPIPSQFDKGVRSYYTDLNAKGGLNGRKIDVVIEDTTSSASVGKTKAQKLIEQDKVFAIVVLDRLENQKAIGDYLESRHVPNLEIQAAPDLTSSKAAWTFGVTIDHVVQGRLIADYFVRSLKATKVAVIQENTPILNPGRQAFTDEIAKLGAEVVFSRAIDGQGNDFSSEALGLSRSGATATWLYMAPTPAAKLSNQADALGYHPTWFANSISWGFDLIFTVGPKALAGARAFSPWLPLSDPRTQAFQDAYRANNNNDTPDDIGIVGWGVGEIVVAGLRKAGPKLGQNNFRDAMQNLSFRPTVWAPISFRPGVHLGANMVAVLKESGGKWALEHDFTDRF